jgi:hypothetical protein
MGGIKGLIRVAEHPEYVYEIYEFSEPMGYAYDDMNGNPYIHTMREIKESNGKYRLVPGQDNLTYNLSGINEYRSYQECRDFLTNCMFYKIIEEITDFT